MFGEQKSISFGVLLNIKKCPYVSHYGSYKRDFLVDSVSEKDVTTFIAPQIASNQNIKCECFVLFGGMRFYYIHAYRHDTTYMLTPAF